MFLTVPCKDRYMEMEIGKISQKQELCDTIHDYTLL